MIFTLWHLPRLEKIVVNLLASRILLFMSIKVCLLSEVWWCYNQLEMVHWLIISSKNCNVGYLQAITGRLEQANLPLCIVEHSTYALQSIHPLFNAKSFFLSRGCCIRWGHGHLSYTAKRDMMRFCVLVVTYRIQWENLSASYFEFFQCLTDFVQINHIYCLTLRRIQQTRNAELSKKLGSIVLSSVIQ